MLPLILTAVAAEPSTFPEATDVSIDVPIGDIVVVATTSVSGVTIIPTEQSWTEDCQLTIQQDGSTASVRVEITDSRRRRRSEGCTIDLSIQLPAAAAFDLDLGIGDVSLTGLAGEVELDVGVGDVLLQTTGPVEADIGAGNLRGSASLLDADIGAGSVHLDSLIGDARLSVSAGDVGLTWLTLPEDIDVSVGAGTVVITLPDGSIFEADLDTGVGNVHSIFEQKNGADHQVEVDVGVGDIKIVH